MESDLAIGIISKKIMKIKKMRKEVRREMKKLNLLEAELKEKPNWFPKWIWSIIVGLVIKQK